MSRPLHALRSFTKATLLGSLAGAAPLLLFTPLIAIESLGEERDTFTRIWVAVVIAAAPLIVTLPIVAAAGIILGLPVTWLLHRLRRESALAYTLAGGAAGFVLPAAWSGVQGSAGGLALTPFGALAGAVTGRIWWRALRGRD